MRVWLRHAGMAQGARDSRPGRVATADGETRVSTRSPGMRRTITHTHLTSRRHPRASGPAILPARQGPRRASRHRRHQGGNDAGQGSGPLRARPGRRDRDARPEEPRAHEVRVRYAASGVCHSDLHHIQGIVPHPTPVVFGHEGAGVIEAVGPDVTGVQVGDHVLTSYIPSCGRCWYCTIGRPNLCDLRDKPRYLLHDGTSRFKKGDQDILQYLQLGTYSEMATVPDVSVIPIRKDAPLEVICLVSCGVMTGFGSVVNRAQVKPGSTVVVYGCGGIGLNAIQAAALVGAAKVIAVDVFDQKLEWAKEFGATHTVNASQVEDPVAAVKEITGRDGADYAIEAVGIQKTMEQAFHSVHRGGTAVMIGVRRPACGSRSTRRCCSRSGS